MSTTDVTATAPASACADRVTTILGPISPDLASFLRTGQGSPAEEAISDARTIADLLASLDGGQPGCGVPLLPELVGRVGHLLQRQIGLAARLYELERQGSLEPAPVVPIHRSD